MAVDAASILAVAQVARIAVELIEQHQKGELTEEELDAAWVEIHARAAAGRQRWEDSKQAPAALARRGEKSDG
ncbi:MAG: hypothetical protein OEU92_09390 [Alphaproteobacteria bacterium]|nr:hypothetical protein [Alphaproteobacteria bacterium]